MLSYLYYALGISLKDFFSEDKEQIQPFLLSALEKLNPQEQLKLAEFINEMKKD